MEIVAENIGKKFNRDWIFRNLSLTLSSAQSIAITGPNGSGKSTLLQIISGHIPSSEGKIKAQKNKVVISEDDLYQYISYAAPYLELIEEMTLLEMVDFHKKFKPLSDRLSSKEFISKINLEKATEKEIRFFSSGMKQRLKLGLAIFSDTPILILDEPTSNMDSSGIDWYLDEIKKQIGKRIILIGSNQRYEYDFCDQEIMITQYQKNNSVSGSTASNNP
jgi:ABC-type multidrug transport system ATPase subunit